MENVLTDFNKKVEKPEIDKSAYISSQSAVIGDVHLGKNVYVGPHAFVRGDEGQSLFVGDNSNIQDGAGIHALETEETKDSEKWEYLDNRLYNESGKLLSKEEAEKEKGYAVYIGKAVSLAHQSLVHGPAYVGDSTFVGMQSQVFNAKIGRHVAIGVKSLITGGVSIPDNTFVPPGSVITTQEQADALGPRIGSPYENTNAKVVHVNMSLANAYNGNKLEKEEHSEAQTEQAAADTTKTYAESTETSKSEATH
ncbi:MAG: carbonic anhydrase [Candidatus Firestonebacteria bacterium]|nr:carbonic anhydrase [Candidatus Firestonebacteria bacterium]